MTPSPLSAWSSLPDPIATRPSHKNNQQPSLFVAQCSCQKPLAYVLLKTIDGSILFNFGLSEEESSNDPWFPSGSANGSSRSHEDSNDSTTDEKYAQKLNLEENKQNAKERILDGLWNNQDVILNSAACIIPRLDKTLQVASIGDNGFLVVRGSTVVARSKPMIRSFFYRYLIGTGGDYPDMAEVYAVRVHENDVVILGSNGIWDNLYEKQVIEIVNFV